jgi:RNA polymerase sigma-70 factor (ECF subfamily)
MLDTTRLSLLVQAGGGAEAAWTRLAEIYQPFVYGWLRRHDVAHEDALDLAQDVLAVVAQELPFFQHSGRPGAFRRWLREVTCHRAKGFWRKSRRRSMAPGSDNTAVMLADLADEHSALSRRWDQEHDAYILGRLLAAVEPSLEPLTMRAFRRLVFDGQAADGVAAELGMSAGAVYSAKSRVLRALRQASAGLVDDDLT